MFSKRRTRKIKEHLGNQEKSTYITVYDDLLVLDQVLLGVDGWLFVLMGLWVGSVLIARISPVLKTHFDWTVALYTLVFSLLVFYYLAFFFFVTAASLRQVTRTVPMMTARILITAAQPYRSLKTGLTARDIGHLRTIAQAEQGAADWRSSFIGVVALGFVSVSAAAAPFVWQIYWDASPIEPGSWDEEVLTLLGRGNSIWWDFVGIAILVVIGLAAIRLYVFVWGFYAREVGNRTILMACEEALGLLEVLKLTDKEDRTLEQKLQFAEHLGCDMYQGDPKVEFLRGSFFFHVEPDGSEWHITPMKGYSGVLDGWLWLAEKTSWMGKMGLRGYAFVRRGVAGVLLWLVEMRRRYREWKISDVEDDGRGEEVGAGDLGQDGRSEGGESEGGGG